MIVPFLDLKRQYQKIKAEIDPAVQKVIEDSAFSGGPYVEAFERDFAKHTNSRYAIGLGSGTDALHLAMRATGIGTGDEVILPVNTFIATAWAVSYVNATPVFADCEPETWSVDPASIEERITRKTKAIIGVHIFGKPFDIDKVKGIADSSGIKLIEDCAQAQGARYKGRRVGSAGEIGCFSFYPGKNLGAWGEAGGVATNNQEYDCSIRAMRNHGSREKYYHETLGFNMRMDGIQGAVLSVKIKYLDEWNQRRRELAARYVKGISNQRIRTQSCPEGYESVYHLFVVTTDDRDGLKRHLEGKGIQTLIHYPLPLHLQKAYSHLGYRKGDFPVAEDLAARCLSLPMFPELTDGEADYVIEALNKF